MIIIEGARAEIYLVDALQLIQAIHKKESSTGK